MNTRHPRPMILPDSAGYPSWWWFNGQPQTRSPAHDRLRARGQDEVIFILARKEINHKTYIFFFSKYWKIMIGLALRWAYWLVRIIVMITSSIKNFCQDYRTAVKWKEESGVVFTEDNTSFTFVNLHSILQCNYLKVMHTPCALRLKWLFPHHQNSFRCCIHGKSFHVFLSFITLLVKIRKVKGSLGKENYRAVWFYIFSSCKRQKDQFYALHECARYAYTSIQDKEAQFDNFHSISSNCYVKVTGLFLLIHLKTWQVNKKKIR